MFLPRESGIRGTLNKLSKTLVEFIETLNPPRALIGEGALLDPNYYGAPENIFRLASALARYNCSFRIKPYLDQAATLLMNAVNDALSLIPKGEAEGLLTLTETVVRKIVEKHDGLTLNEIHETMKQQTPSIYDRETVNSAIESLRRKGYIHVDS